MQRAYNDCGGKVKVRNSLKVQMRKNILKYSKMSKNIGNTKWNEKFHKCLIPFLKAHT